MKTLLLSTVLFAFVRVALATQADDTTIMISGQTAGATPFLSQLTLVASDTTTIKSIRFSVASKPESSIRPLSAIYARTYLAERGDVNEETGTIFLPVYGLYDSYTNLVSLTYLFNDGSSKEDNTTITTATFDDPCGYKTPTVLQAKTEQNSLSYDYILLKGSCSIYSPAIIDTDGALRWVGTASQSSYNLAFFENSIYIANGAALYRNDLDGTVTLLGDYADAGVNKFHHNVDFGKFGLLFEADTDDYFESVFMEIDREGHLLKTWNMANIISEAMIAGGDDPSLFVYPNPADWFHNNAVAYNRADDSLIVSSREDFVISIDYTTGAIKWILGDPEKAWYQFPSLRKYALTLDSGGVPPIGQHAVSVTYDQGILMFDNGTASLFQQPPGATRNFASPRKYRIDLATMTATEVWNYPMDESVASPFCGSVYEDLPLNYLVDYAFVSVDSDGNRAPRILGLDATGAKVFYYQYPAANCSEIFNATPLHLEATALPAVGPQSLNVSTRGLVTPGEGALIAGFIVNGTESKTVVLRALGPSLGDSGLSETLPDPRINLFDSSGALVATNDNWGDDPDAAQIAADGLAPDNPAEAALRPTLAPGAYTAVVSSADATQGISLVEAYDLSPLAASTLANLSTRGQVQDGDGVLVSGFIVGDTGSSTVVVRALGPSLSSFGVNGALSDPRLTIFDGNGLALLSNDNWQDDVSATEIEQNGLAPAAAAESATIAHLPPGAYTSIITGVNGSSGVGLVEIYNLE